MFDTRTRLFFFACQKDAVGTASRSGHKKNRLRLHPKSGGFKLLRLRITGYRQYAKFGSFQTLKINPIPGLI